MMHINNISTLNRVTATTTDRSNRVVDIQPELLTQLVESQSVIGTVAKATGDGIVGVVTQYGNIVLQINERLIVNQNINISIIRGVETKEGTNILRVTVFDVADEISNIQNNITSNYGSNAHGAKCFKDCILPSNFLNQKNNMYNPTVNDTLDVESRADVDDQAIIIQKHGTQDKFVPLILNSDLDINQIKIPHHVREFLLMQQGCISYMQRQIIPKGTLLNATIDFNEIDIPRDIRIDNGNIIMRGQVNVQNKLYNAFTINTPFGVFILDNSMVHDISELMRNTNVRNVTISIHEIKTDAMQNTQTSNDTIDTRFSIWTDKFNALLQSKFFSDNNNAISLQQKMLQLLTALPSTNTNNIAKQNMNIQTIQNIPMPLYTSYYGNGLEIHQMLYNCAAIILQQGGREFNNVTTQKWQHSITNDNEENETLTQEFLSLIDNIKLKNQQVQPDEWQTFLIPLVNKHNIETVKFFIKPATVNSATYSKRFVVEISNAEGVKHWMDCLFIKNSDRKELNIIMRMSKPLHNEIQNGITEVLNGVTKSIGIDGKISFVLQDSDYGVQITQKAGYSVPV